MQLDIYSIHTDSNKCLFNPQSYYLGLITVLMLFREE